MRYYRQCPSQCLTCLRWLFNLFLPVNNVVSTQAVISTVTYRRSHVQLSVVARRTYLIDFLFELPSMYPHAFRFPLWFLRPVAAPFIMRRDISSATHSFSWHTNPFTYPPQRINQWMSSMTNGVAKYADLDHQFNHFQWSPRHTMTEMRRRAVVLQARNIWPEKNVRPPKEVVVGPVRNADSSLMLHVPDNECSNSLVADYSALKNSRNAI